MKKILFLFCVAIATFLFATTSLFGQYNATYYEADKLPDADYFVATKYVDNSGMLYFQITVFRNDSLIWLFKCYEFEQTQNEFHFWINGNEQILSKPKTCLPTYSCHTFGTCTNCEGYSNVYKASYDMDKKELQVIGFGDDGHITEAFISPIFVYTDSAVHLWKPGQKTMYTFK